MKVADSYSSLIRGVSQQAPEVRVSGQHEEQVNLLSDPVAGLTRRRGTILQKISAIEATDAVSTLASANGYQTIKHTTGGKEYIVLLRDRPSLSSLVTSLPPVMCYCITDNLWLTMVWNNAQGWRGEITNRGVSAAVSVGQYVMFGMNDFPCSSLTTQVHAVAGNQRAVVWIRGGTYNRTYSVTLPGGTFTYTTPDASAPGAAAAITPIMIAYNLAMAGAALGVTGVLAAGSHFTFDVPYSATADISVSDGGDGALMRGIYSVVSDITQLPINAIDGQIIKVQASLDSWFYVQAHAKVSSGTLIREVIWREAAGQVQGVQLQGLGIAKVSGNSMYVGVQFSGDYTGLGHMAVPTPPVPTVVPSLAGDIATNVAPRWMSNVITYLGLFQDRLLVGSGAALAVSAAGDYLNFFRSTMTTVPVKDGFEMVAQGGEDDSLRHSVAYNKNLVIFGDKRQYIISGTVALTPTSANMAIMTVYADAAECRPVAAGGQIYYARNREGSVGVYQIQPGAYVDSAESFPASAQVGSYIAAPAAEIEAVAGSPALLLVRSRSTPRSLYVFSYIDQPDGRKQDAWYRWDFDEQCGNLLSAVSTPNGVLLLWARVGASGYVYLVADLLPLSTAASTLPYLDSLRLNSLGAVAGGMPAGGAGWKAAFDATTDRFLIGADYDDAADMAALASEYPAEMSSLWVGLPFPSYVVPTNPYTRDKDGIAILTGRLTVTTLKVNTKKSSGMDWELTAGGLVKEGSFNGRRVGDLLNSIGKVPVSSSVVSIPVGRETRAYSLKLMARKWFPLNMIGIEWTGQSFNRTARAKGGK